MNISSMILKVIKIQVKGTKCSKDPCKDQGWPNSSSKPFSSSTVKSSKIILGQTSK